MREQRNRAYTKKINIFKKTTASSFARMILNRFLFVIAEVTLDNVATISTAKRVILAGSNPVDTTDIDKAVRFSLFVQLKQVSFY